MRNQGSIFTDFTIQPIQLRHRGLSCDKCHAHRRLQSFVEELQDLFFNDFPVALYTALGISEIKICHLIQHQLVALEFLNAKPREWEGCQKIDIRRDKVWTNHGREEWSSGVQVQWGSLLSNAQKVEDGIEANPRQCPQRNPHGHKLHSTRRLCCFCMHTELVVTSKPFKVAIIP